MGSEISDVLRRHGVIVDDEGQIAAFVDPSKVGIYVLATQLSLVHQAIISGELALGGYEVPKIKNFEVLALEATMKVHGKYNSQTKVFQNAFQAGATLAHQLMQKDYTVAFVWQELLQAQADRLQNQLQQLGNFRVVPSDGLLYINSQHNYEVAGIEWVQYCGIIQGFKAQIRYVVDQIEMCFDTATPVMIAMGLDPYAEDLKDVAAIVDQYFTMSYHIALIYALAEYYRDDFILFQRQISGIVADYTRYFFSKLFKHRPLGVTITNKGINTQLADSIIDITQKIVANALNIEKQDVLTTEALRRLFLGTGVYPTQYDISAHVDNGFEDAKLEALQDILQAAPVLLSGDSLTEGYWGGKLLGFRHEVTAKRRNQLKAAHSFVGDYDWVGTFYDEDLHPVLPVDIPFWITDPRMRASHQRSLLFKRMVADLILKSGFFTAEQLQVVETILAD